MRDISFPSLDWAISLPTRNIPAALSEIAAKQSALAAIQSRLTARLLEGGNEAVAAGVELVDAATLASRLGVHESFVRTAARERRIPCIRIGRYVRFDPTAVATALAGTER